MIEVQQYTGGDLYETIFLRTMTLRAQDKDCPSGKEASLRADRGRSQEQARGSLKTKSLRQGAGVGG